MNVRAEVGGPAIALDTAPIVARKRQGSGRLRRMVRRFGYGRAFAVVLMVLMLAVRWWDPAPVEALRLRTFDAFQVLQPRVGGQLPVAIVDIDEASLRALGQWPWPRTVVADLVTRLTRMGAVAIAFDVVFAEPDRMSPALMARNFKNLPPDAVTALQSLPSNDQVLADAIKASRVVLAQTALSVPDGDDALDSPRTGIGLRGPDPSPFLPFYPGLLRGLPLLENAAAGRGLITIQPERDGIVRRVPMILKADGEIVPSLTLDLLRVLTGSGAILVKTDTAGIQSLALPGFELPTDPEGRIWVHFSPHDPARFVSAKDVLAGTLAPGRLANKIVFVGTSALGLLDTKTTPIDQFMPGVEIHTQILESALTHATLVSPHYAVLVEMLVAAAVGTGIIILAPVLGALNLLALGSAVAAFLAAASWYRYAHDGVLLDATFPMALSLIVYLALTFLNYFREQAGRHRIRSAFSQYLSPALVERLAQSPEKLKLGGEERRMTIMFSDVRGFTTISEFYKYDPAGLTALMNRFLTPLTNAILNRRGTIDKYMGDAIMAFWNAPLDDDEQEMNAAQAALDMLARMDALNAQRKVEAESGGFPVLPLDIGIGINTGNCVVGNMGSDLRFDYSVLGDSVNLASRIEGQSKAYGLKIILGEDTASVAAQRYAVLEIDLIQVKGKHEPARISTLVGDAATRISARFVALKARHDELLAAYRGRDWDRAAEAGAACREIGQDFGLDGLYRLYADRVAAFRLAAPPADWTGVFEATTK